MDEKLERLIENFSKKTLTDFLYYKNLDINERRIPQYDNEQFAEGSVLGEIDLVRPKNPRPKGVVMNGWLSLS